MIVENFYILEEIFNWLSITEVSKEEIYRMSQNLDIFLEQDFYVKSKWGHFKKYFIFTLENKPLLFIKNVTEHFIEEVLGLHLSIDFFNTNLTFNKYLAGIYTVGFWKFKHSIPYMMTPYEEGKDLSKYEITKFKHELGRQAYFHEILSLYDVYDRHFIVRNDNTLCRIDLGRSFENLNKKYLGFFDFMRSHKLQFEDEEFQRGYEQEEQLIKKNIENKKEGLIELFQSIKNLKRDNEIVTFDVNLFLEHLSNYWKQMRFLEMDTEKNAIDIL